MNSRYIKKWVLILLFIPICICLQAQQMAKKFIVETNYLLYLPEGYEADTTSQWPLMLFLHGAGETGDDIQKVKTHGPPKLIEEGRKFPFIVVSPQAKTHGWRSEELYDFLQSVFKQYRVDKDRVYLTGLSMGGFGTWAMAMKYPTVFAAIAPICGGGDTTSIWTLQEMPVWCFHGAKDNIVPLSSSQAMVDALRKYNPDVKFTIYPDVDHGSWNPAYNNDSLYNWMLHHKRYTLKQISISPSLLNQYIGIYVSPKNDSIRFTVENNGLRLTP